MAYTKYSSVINEKLLMVLLKAQLMKGRADKKIIEKTIKEHIHFCSLDKNKSPMISERRRNFR